MTFRKVKQVGLYVMAAFYGFTGVVHLMKPEMFEKIVPPFIPFAFAIALISGLVELFLALALLNLKTRRSAAWGVIALLIMVFPANVYMFMIGETAFPDIPRWALLLRLPLQLLLIGWAYIYTRPTFVQSQHVEPTPD